MRYHSDDEVESSKFALISNGCTDEIQRRDGYFRFHCSRSNSPVEIEMSKNPEESLLSATSESYFLVAEVKKSKADVCQNTKPSPIPPEALLSKSSQRVLSAKQKGRSISITEVPESDIHGNPIGMLQELCMMRRWMPPDYTTEQEEGLPHERLFTIQCAVGNFREYGIGRSKKLAKRQSAHKMVQKILKIPIEDETSLRNLEEDDEMEKGTKEMPSTNGISKKVSLFHRNLKGFTGAALQKLKDTEIRDIDRDEAIQWLEEIAKDNNVVVTRINVPQLSKSNEHQFMIQLSTVPVTVCFGTADSEENAMKEAAIHSLHHIRLLSK